MKQQPEQRALWPFLVAALCQAVYPGLAGQAVHYTAREGLIAAALTGLLVWAALALLAGLPGRGLCPPRGAVGWLWALVLTAGLAWAAVQTLCRMNQLYRRQYQGSGAWILLLALALLLLRPSGQVLERMALAVLALAAAAVLGLALGLAPQMHWSALSPAAPQPAGVGQALGDLFYFCPEFLALPWLAKTPRHKLRLPLAVAALQAGALLAAELVFGSDAAQGRWPMSEAVRSWGLGAFSRFDPVAVGLWLVLTLYRLLLIGCLLGQLWAGQTPGRAAGEAKA